MTWRLAGCLVELSRELRGQRPGLTLYTYRAGPVGPMTAGQDHTPWVIDSRGVGVVRAIDVMLYSDVAAQGVLARNMAAKLGKHPAMMHGAYVISRQHIISFDRLSEGWRLMEDRGSPTANHMDHVHISVTESPQAGYDSRAKWGALFVGKGTGGTAPGPVPTPTKPGKPATVPGTAPGQGTIPVQNVDPSGNPIATPGRHAQPGIVRTTGTLPGVAGTAAAGVSDIATGVVGNIAGDVTAEVRKVIVIGGALMLGVVLLALGAARATRPARQEATEQAGQAATLLVPEARAATAATTATRGTP